MGMDWDVEIEAARFSDGGTVQPNVWETKEYEVGVGGGEAGGVG